MADIKMYGRLILEMDVETVTGLHIGGSSAGLEIGGVNNPVIRDVLTQEPYIPGSSLKGKIRSQLEKALGAKQNTAVGQATIHTCKTKAEYEKCVICQIFGAPGETEAVYPTRLVVRDVRMHKDSVKDLKSANTDMAFTELKTEVAIDRVTSAAVPRDIERVPAGTVFGKAEMVFSLFEKTDHELFKHIVAGLQLLEDDYLGGSGSRGSGKVVFKEIVLTGRNADNYTTSIPLDTFGSVQEFANKFDAINFKKVYEG